MDDLGYTALDLDKAYKQGLENGRYEAKAEFEVFKINATRLKTESYNKGYQRGYADCDEKLHSVMAERKQDLQEKAWDEGFLAAVEEMTVCNDVFNIWDFGAIEDKTEKKPHEFYSNEEDGYEASKEESELLDKFIKLKNSEKDENKPKKVDDSFDMVNKPKHYNSHPSGIQCIEVTRHYNFAIGSAIKYLWRNGLKDSPSKTQDLEKAAWYIQDEIERIKKES